MTTKLTNEQIAEYREKGFVSPIKVMSGATAATHLNALSVHENTRGYRFTREERRKPHLLFSWLDKIAHLPSVLDAVESLIGPDILVVSSSLFIKEPRTTRYIGWHQDATYWTLSPMTVITAWVALSPSHHGNGCVQMAAGTHRGRSLPHVETDDENNDLSRRQNILQGIAEEQVTDIVLAPGEMSLHDFNIAHCSGANPSDVRRVGFAVRYIPPDLRQTAGPAMSACLARGVDRFHHFDPEPRPTRDFDPIAVAYRDALLERHAVTGYATL